MDVSMTLSAPDLAKVQSQVDALNKTLNDGKEVTQSLNKDDFLKILITQLSHQDPTAPMQDKEFIAQMAQFSSLEQMTNLSTGFTKLAAMMDGSKAVNLLGKDVELEYLGQTIAGKVDEVMGQDHPQVLVNGQYYDASAVRKVRLEGGDAQ